MRARCAISGIGLVTPLGVDVDSSWKGISNGRSGIGPLSALECSTSDPERATRRGGEVPLAAASRDEGCPQIEMDRRELELLDRAVDEALRSAGFLDRDHRPNSDRIAVLLATTLGGMRRAAAFFRGSDARVLETFLAGDIGRHVAARVGATGLVSTVTAACASGLSVMLHARALLKAREADLVVAVGYDTISEYAYGGFASLRLIASADPRPFHRMRDGMRLGEACAVLTLERPEDVYARGHAPIAVLAGAGESSDAFHLTRPHPEGEGLVRALRAAMDDATVESHQIAMISLHGTGTPANDAAERAALHAVLGDCLGKTPAVAFKAATGHTLGAAGAVELALSAIALTRGEVPPTAGVERAALEFDDLAMCERTPQAMTGDCTLGISLGFGGSNAVVVLARPGASASVTDDGWGMADRAPIPLAITGVGFHGSGSVRDAASLAQRLHARDRDSPEGDGDAASEVDEEALDERAGGRRARRMSLYARLMLAATREAVAHAGVDANDLADAAALLASAHGACGYTERYYEQLVREGLDAANPLWFAEGVPNVGSAQVSMALGIRGATQTVMGSRTAGMDAIHLARMRVGERGWSRVLVGAAEERSDAVSGVYAAFGLHAGTGLRSGVVGRRGFRSSSAAAALMLERAGDAPGRPLATIDASAARSARECTMTGMRDAVADVLTALGPVDAVVSSWNGTWIGVAELAGIALALNGRRVPTSAIYGELAETFAVGPLAAIVGVVLTGAIPPTPRALPRVRGVLRTDVPLPAERVAVLASAYDGTVRGVRIAVAHRVQPLNATEPERELR